jgi:hypothetical protein
MTKHNQKKRRKPTDHYTPSSQMADNLATNRAGHLTKTQKAPILMAALVTGVGLTCSISFLVASVYGFVQTVNVAGIFGWIMLIFTGGSIAFLTAVLWVNAKMFIPETLSKSPVKWEQGILEIKMASRERPEMPFSYIIGAYSFAPFVVPDEVPMNSGREYVVYYTARSRLLLSIAPMDLPEADQWLPKRD